MGGHACASTGSPLKSGVALPLMRFVRARLHHEPLSIQVFMKLGSTGFYSNRLFPTEGLGDPQAGWHYVYPVHEVGAVLPLVC